MRGLAKRTRSAASASSTSVGRKRDDDPRLGPEPLELVDAERVADRVGDRLETASQPVIREQGVTGVEQPELALLVRFDVVDESAPPASQAGRPAGNSPLSTHSLNGSVMTGTASAQPVRASAVDAIVVRGRRGDAVDHRGHEGHVVVDPAGERRRSIAAPDEQTARGSAVGGQVVAADDRDRPGPGIRSGAQAVEQPARRRSTRRAVAGLRHRERDARRPPDRRRPNARPPRSAPSVADDDALDRPRPVAGRRPLDQGVDAVLRGERDRGIRSPTGERGDPPVVSAVVGELRVPGLMCAVERAEPEVHDPRRMPFGAHGSRHPVSVARRTSSWSPRSTSSTSTGRPRVADR